MKNFHSLALSAVCAGLLLPSIFAADEATPHDKAAAQSPSAPVKVKNLGVDAFEAKAKEKKSVILDVRTPKEYQTGHLPGAVNIDFNSPDFDKKISELDTNKTYLVHCAAGGRSAKACDKMGRLPFKDVYNLEGGLNAWKKAGKEVEK